MDAEYNFVNFTIPHDVSYGAKPSPATVQINRGSPLLYHMEDFKASVQRLILTTLTIPQYAAQLEVGTKYDQNRMIYKFAISQIVAGVEQFSVLEQVIWVSPTKPERVQPPGATTVTKSLQSDNEYYHSDIPGVLEMFNTALRAICEAPGNANITPITAGNPCPMFVLAEAGIRMYIPPTFVKAITAPADGLYRIYFNNQTYSLMNGFPQKQGKGSGYDNYFSITSINAPSNISIGSLYKIFAPPTYSYGFWSPCSKILVTTTLPLVYEQVPGYNPNQGLIVNNTVTTSTNMAPQSSVLADFSPDFSQLSSYQTQLVFNKVDSTVFATIVGNDALTGFAMQLFWVDQAGLNVPMVLAPLTSCSIKIEFIKNNFEKHVMKKK